MTRLNSLAMLPADARMFPVVVLITGTGSKSGGKTTSTTAPVALLAQPPNTFTQTFTVNETQAPAGIKAGDTVTLAGLSNDQTPLTISNIFVQGISTATSN